MESGESPDLNVLAGFRTNLAAALLHLGQWNQGIITCKGDTIRMEINGKLVNQGTGAAVTRGRILLSSGNADVYFRNVTLQALK